MRLKDILNCSRRMFFENASEDYEYSGRGTCFLCRFRGHDFAITVNHVVKGYEADSIRVLFHQAAREFVPHNAKITIKAEEIDRNDDDDWTDLAIFPLERSLYSDNQFADQPPYEILSENYLWEPGMRGRFILRGFSHDRSYIDYDVKVLREQAVILEADYAGPSPMKHCYCMRFRDLSHCSDLDGLSGSPVFWVSDSEPRVQCFAGVAVRGTLTSATSHFIQGSVVVAALTKALSQR